MFPSKYLDRNNIVSSMFRIQYIPDFFVVEHYGLQNTTSGARSFSDTHDTFKQCCRSELIFSDSDPQFFFELGFGFGSLY
jgi:hypothetical protein